MVTFDILNLICPYSHYMYLLYLPHDALYVISFRSLPCLCGYRLCLQLSLDYDVTCPYIGASVFLPILSTFARLTFIYSVTQCNVTFL